MRFLKFFLNILYPPLCLHCEEHLEKDRTLFCTVCLEQMAPIDPEGRCRICFAEEHPCQRCMARTVAIKRQAAACSYFGSARTLAAYLKKGNTQFLSAAASLMLLQFSHLEWPLPDLIVPIPGSLWERCKKGKNINTLLAKEMARLLDCRCETVLRAVFDTRALLEKAEIRTRPVLIDRKKKHLYCDHSSCVNFDSARRSKIEAKRSERGRPFPVGKADEEDRFGKVAASQNSHNLSGRSICDKRILLIAVQLDDALLRQAAEALQEGFLLEIFALAFYTETT